MCRLALLLVEKVALGFDRAVQWCWPVRPVPRLKEWATHDWKCEAPG